MRRVTYKSVQDLVADALGWEASNLSTDQQLLINRSINRRAAFAWDAFPWPEWTVVQRRRFALSWGAAFSYAAGDIRFDPSAETYWVALQGPSLGHLPSLEDGWWGAAAPVYQAEDYDALAHYTQNDRVYDPDTDTTYQLHAATAVGVPTYVTASWGALVNFERVIPYEQTGATPLGDILHAYDRNPRLLPGACELPFRLQDNGVRVEGTLATVYLEFRLRPPSWSGSIHSLTAGYNEGDQVYYAGDYYRALDNHYNVLPTDANLWARIDMPYVLSRYVAEASYGDVDGKNQGQTDKLPSIMEESFGFLSLEWDKIERQQSQRTQIQIAK